MCEVAGVIARWQRRMEAVPAATAICAAVVLAYLIACAVYRFGGAFGEFAYDGDQLQAVWHYWRYHIDGAFPPGNLNTDYAFVMHAPLVWWIFMAGLSTFVEPTTAALILNLFAFFATAFAAWWVVRGFAPDVVAATAAMLVGHSQSFHLITAGGYARTFGPLLILLFLGLWIRGRHRAVLGVLIMQAALYPSVVIPCGLAYGIRCILFAGDDRLRHTIEVSIVGVIVILFGQYQTLGAEDWWGSVVWESEARQMASWGSGGRINEAPLGNPTKMLLSQMSRVVQPIGHRIQALGRFGESNFTLVMWSWIAMLLTGGVLWNQREGDDEVSSSGRWPTQGPGVPPLIFGFFLAVLAAWIAARIMAFKLYLPYRPLNHGLPVLFFVGFPMAAWVAWSRLWRTPRRPLVRELTCAVLLVLLPVAVFYGDGLGRTKRSTFGSRPKDEPHFKFIRTLPLDATLAGNLYVMDRVPLFAYHQIYVSRIMSHPFRKGLLAEFERRIEENYKALWTADPCVILDFAEREKITHLAYTASSLKKFDKRIFAPVSNRLRGAWSKTRTQPPYLLQPAADAVLYNKADWWVVDLDKLQQSVGETCAP